MLALLCMLANQISVIPQKARMHEMAKRAAKCKLCVCISKNTCKTLRHEPPARSPDIIDAIAA